MRTGTIYLLEAEKYLKVGFTTSFSTRLKTIQMAVPMYVRVLATRPGTEDEEIAFHQSHEDYLVGYGSREWYFDTDSFRAEALAFLGVTKQRIEISEVLPADVCEQACEQESVQSDPLSDGV